MTTILEQVSWRYLYNGEDVLLPTGVSWASETPLEVCIKFGINLNAVEWVFARDLLNDALRMGCAGVGDVCVEVRDDIMMLHLRSPYGEIKLRTPVKCIEGFVKRIYDEVPSGAEVYDLDKAAEQLLAPP